MRRIPGSSLSETYRRPTARADSTGSVMIPGTASRLSAIRARLASGPAGALFFLFFLFLLLPVDGGLERIRWLLVDLVRREAELSDRQPVRKARGRQVVVVLE